MKSILTDKDECFICHGKVECEHHIYFGPKRKISERWGFKVPLCNRCHNMSEYAVHFNKERDRYLKMICQEKFEETHSHEEFMRLIGIDYLEG